MNLLQIIGLVLAGTVSPLLTFAYLWQVKEWRIDRLKEHLRAEGAFRQLWGIIRPTILFVGLCAFFALPESISPQHLFSGTLIAFALLSLVQLLLRKQRMPVWTQKAIVLTATGVAINALLAYALPLSVLPLIVLIQPLILLCAWLLFWPLDKILKMRIMKKAMHLRASCTDVTVIGITGSAGKTTTKELLSHLLEGQSVNTTPVHVNTEMGVSKWLLQILSKAEKPKILIVEMGAYRQGEIALLCRIAQPNIGIVTHVGMQHIALFGSQTQLQKTKGELVTALPENGKAYLNADSELCAQLSDFAHCPVTNVGTGGTADLKAKDIEETQTGIRLNIEGEAYSTTLHGTHNSTNVLLAVAVAKDLGIETNVIRSHLQSFVPPKRTFSVRKEGNRTILDDTHNASPESFAASMNWARSQPAQQKILLTSGLIELGANQDKVHTELGTKATDIFDRVIFLSKSNMKAFSYGYGKSVEMYTDKDGDPIPENALLACIGRMSPSTISGLLQR